MSPADTPGGLFNSGHDIPSGPGLTPRGYLKIDNPTHPPIRKCTNMKSLWHETVRDEMLARIARLTPETRPVWGRMSCSEMLAHVLAGMRMGSGELPTRLRKTFLRWWPLNELLVRFVPFPRGAKAPREIVVTTGSDVDWTATVGALNASIHSFETRDAKTFAWPVHPVFGKISAGAWGRLAYKHMDHHLRQFGV